MCGVTHCDKLQPWARRFLSPLAYLSALCGGGVCGVGGGGTSHDELVVRGVLAPVRFRVYSILRAEAAAMMLLMVVYDVIC